ncbi:hypothetical protein [Virgibacillus salexigens]|uniref:Uncharacterized protein n=1 Tax=Virgibacillus kapii TaxID=1638645 RepID=A0ABQ2DBP7_9BACI|nr:hypothetical protein [Virgibacillus kapii]GGJ51173.1 hypothetical protein GCM10007111_11760 [Virgibacillus kapii]
MELNIEVVEGNKRNSLQMKGATQESEKTAINNFFKLMNVDPDTKLESPPKEQNIALLNNETAKHEVVKHEKEEVKRSKKLPLLGSETRSNFSVYESVEDKEGFQKPDHWITGIKTDEDGSKRYKCRYWCECGGKGNHYIPLDVEEVECRDCGDFIDVYPATDEIDQEGVPERDDFGNFFVARY